MSDQNTRVTTEYLRNNLFKKDVDFYSGLKIPTQPWAYDLDYNFFTAGDALNEQAINMSILNIILSIKGEYLFEPAIGSALGFALFENITTTKGEEVLDEIIASVEAVDARVSFVQSECRMTIDPDNHSVSLDLPYIVRNLRRMGTFSKTISI